MNDTTETTRREMIDSGQPQRDLVAELHKAALRGDEKAPTWTTDELREEFEVQGYMAPYVVVKRKSDGAMGSLEFTHSPRLYFGWRKHEDRS